MFTGLFSTTRRASLSTIFTALVALLALASPAMLCSLLHQLKSTMSAFFASTKLSQQDSCAFDAVVSYVYCVVLSSDVKMLIH